MNWLTIKEASKHPQVGISKFTLYKLLREHPEIKTRKIPGCSLQVNLSSLLRFLSQFESSIRINPLKVNFDFNRNHHSISKNKTFRKSI